MTTFTPGPDDYVPHVETVDRKGFVLPGVNTSDIAMTWPANMDFAVHITRYVTELHRHLKPSPPMPFDDFTFDCEDDCTVEDEETDHA